MFSYFEKLIDPFPDEPSGQPPNTLFAYCWHYTKGHLALFRRDLRALAAIVSAP